MLFDQFGITFEYPDNWSIDIDSDDVGSSSATVQSPDGAFWNLSAYRSGTKPKDMVQVVSSQMQKEFQDIDVELASETRAEFQITPGNPNSASSQFQHRLRFIRQGSIIEVLGNASLKSSASDYYVFGRLEAWENGEMIFKREWHPVIPRKHS